MTVVNVDHGRLGHGTRTVPLVPDGDQWQVKRDGTPAGGGFEVKTTAVDYATEQAKGMQPAQVVIHGEDGRIQDESTYQDDPFPPRG